MTQLGVKLIESSCLNLYDKIELLLCFLGAKPAASFVIDSTYLCKEQSSGIDFHFKAKEAEVKNFSNLLDVLNLEYKTRTVIFDNDEWRTDILENYEFLFSKKDAQFYLPGAGHCYNPVEFCLRHIISECAAFYVSTQKELLEDLLFACESKNDEMEGLLYGYPATSVLAYSGKLKRDNDKELNLRPELMYLIQFIMSEEFFYEELQTVLEWENIIKKESPDLYEQIGKEEGVKN